MTVLVFGHGAPLADPLLAGLAPRDITRIPADLQPGSRIAPLLEPFLDPFVRAFLAGLEAGAHRARAILVWRQGPGALIAFRHAQELRRLGLLPPDPPLLLWNRARPGPGAARFDAAQTARLRAALADLSRGAAPDLAGPLATLEALQAGALIPGATAQRRRLSARATGRPVDATAPGTPHGTAPDPAPGPRLALAGAPLGNDALQARLQAQGPLVLDLTGPDPPQAEVAALLAARRVARLFWQVDPHDDLHGWRMPDLRATCGRLGIDFVDLGFLPAWPGPADLARLPLPPGPGPSLGPTA